MAESVLIGIEPESVILSSPEGKQHIVLVRPCSDLCWQAQQLAAGYSEGLFVHEQGTGMFLITCLNDPLIICGPELANQTR